MHNQTNISLPDGAVVMLGIPCDENSSHLRGAAQAPRAIREAFYSPSANLYSERGFDFGNVLRFVDFGDLKDVEGPAGPTAISQQVEWFTKNSAKLLCIGGDHSITHPILAGMADHYGQITIVQIDAHGDLYDEYQGNRSSHACPFARIMEQDLATRLIQFGNRTLTEHQREQAQRFGVEIAPVDSHDLSLLETIEGNVYVSLDMDGLDPAFAPGVSHPEPGGLSTRHVIEMIHLLHDSPLVHVVGADIVEYNPVRDMNGLTAMVAAKLAKEVASLLFSA